MQETSLHWTIWNEEMRRSPDLQTVVAPEAPDLKIRKIYFYQKLIINIFRKKKKRKKETKVKDKGKKEKETRKEEKKNH